MRKGEKIAIGLGVVGFLAAILGIKIFDITIADIFNRQFSKVEVKAEPERQIPSGEQFPKVEVKTESERQQVPQKTRDTEVRKLQLPRLMSTLKDLPSSSDKLDFMKKNMNAIPDSFSWNELEGILNMFPSSSRKLTVINTLLSRLPNSLSLGKLNHILGMFYFSSNKLTITEIFLPRLEDNYSDREFERFRNHYPSSSDKKKAINLLLRK